MVISMELVSSKDQFVSTAFIISEVSSTLDKTPNTPMTISKTQGSCIEYVIKSCRHS